MLSLLAHLHSPDRIAELNVINKKYKGSTINDLGVEEIEKKILMPLLWEKFSRRQLQVKTNPFRFFLQAPSTRSLMADP